MPFQSDFTQRRVTVDGVDVTYYDTSSFDDERTPVMLVHGTGGSAYGSFSSLMPMLSFKYRVIAVDLVDCDLEKAEISNYVQQCLAVIEASTRGRSVRLVGYSLGAVVAATLAFQAPKVVEDLVLIAGWLRTDAHQMLRNRLWFQINEIAPELLPEFTVLTSYSHRFIASKTDADVRSLVMAASGGPDRAAKMRINRGVDLSEIAPDIRTRTLVIGCTEDQMVPISHSYALYASIPNATFVDVRAGHLVVRERPAELFKRIHDFVSRSSKHLDGGILDAIHA